MEAELRTRLLNDATISGLVSTRVDWGVRPQGKPLPAITLLRVPGEHAQTMSGLMATQGPQIQIDCWADKYADTVTLRNAVVALLATAATQGSVHFMGATDMRDTDLPEKTDVGMVHRSMIRATVWHTT